MKTKTFLNVLTVTLFTAIIIQACSKDDDKAEEPAEPAQFVADNTTFSDYLTWPVRATATGSDPAIGTRHGENDTSVVRTIYVKDGQDAVDGTFPQGTIMVKVSANPSGTLSEITAMVKRGGNFNTANGGWEWFMLNADGTIIKNGNGDDTRGGELFGCHSCHKFATTDFVYSMK